MTMGKRQRSSSGDRSKSQVFKKKYRPTANENVKPKKSKKGGKSKKVKAVDKLAATIQATTKAAKLLSNPVTVNPNEFDQTTTFEVMKHVKFLGMTKKTNKPYTQEWQKEGDKIKLTQPKVFSKFVEVEPPVKQTISGQKVDVEPSFDSDDDCHNQGCQLKKKKKKKNKQTKVKQTYDKAPEAVQPSQSTQDKNSGVDLSEGSSVGAPVDRPPRPVKCVDVSAWDTLHVPKPIKEVLSELGFSQPTEIQKLTIGEAIKTNCDILGAAETGSGKTLAFGIPIIAGLVRDANRRQKQAEDKVNIEHLKEKTALSKKKRDEARHSDDEENSSEESAAESDEYEEAEESEGEEYLFNGPDGILEVDYSDLDMVRKSQKKKSKDRDDSDIDSEEDDESDVDMEEGDADVESNSEMGSEEDESFDEQEMGSDDEEHDVREYEEELMKNGTKSNGKQTFKNGHLDSGSEEEDSDNEVGDLDGEEGDLDGEEGDLEMEEDLDEEGDSDSDHGDNFDSEQSQSDVEQSEFNSETDNSDSDDNDNLGSSEEEDIDSDGDDGEKMGCIRAINNVVFPFAINEQQQRFKDDGEKRLLRALILTPTRELAVQVHCSLSRLCRAAGVRSCVVVGGLDSRKQRRILTRTTPELVVGTPGRLWELAQDGVQHLAELRGVRYLAIDEADRMIDRKNFEEVHKIVRLMSDGLSKNKACSNRQTFVFSATLTMVHKLPDRLTVKHKSVASQSSADKLRTLAKMVGMKPSAKILDVTRQHATAENLTECRINCELTDKDQYLYYFLQRHPGRTMVFCNSIDGVRRLRSIFDLLKCNPVDLHASMHQKQRLRNLQHFRSSPQGLLITTDVAARGLDIAGVQHVVHFQVPFTAESYVHRSGRTARGTQCGLSVVFIEPKDLLRFRQICSTLGRTSVNEIPAFPVDENLYDQVDERVRLAVSLEKQLHKVKRDEQFKKESKLVEEHAGIMSSDEEIDQEDLKLMPAAFQRQYRSGGIKAELKRMRARLDQLVQQPLLGALFSYSHPLNKAALAAGMGTKAADIPNELVGMNPTRSICAEDAEAAYQDRYAKEIYGEVPEEEADGKVNVCAVLKQQKKDLAKLTRKLIKPELTAREKMIRMKEKKKELQQKRATKKREKRKKRKMRGGITK